MMLAIAMPAGCQLWCLPRAGTHAIVQMAPGGLPGHGGDMYPQAPGSPRAVLDFWFGDGVWGTVAMGRPWLEWPDRNGLWWGSQPDMSGPFSSAAATAVGQRCQCFCHLIRQCGRGELCGDAWESSDGIYAQMLLCNQLARNAFRGSAEAFAHGARAFCCARQLFESGACNSFPPKSKPSVAWVFLVASGQHSELLADREINEQMVAYMESRWGATHVLVSDLRRKVAEHAEVVARFGRYPHRNAALGRRSTPAEKAWLAKREELPDWAVRIQGNGAPAAAAGAAQAPLPMVELCSDGKEAVSKFHRDGFALMDSVISAKQLAHFGDAHSDIQREWYEAHSTAGAGGTMQVDQEGGRLTPLPGHRSYAVMFLEILRRWPGDLDSGDSRNDGLAIVEQPRVLELARRALNLEPGAQLVIDQVSVGDSLSNAGDAASGLLAFHRTDSYNDAILKFTGSYPAGRVGNQFRWHTDRTAGATQLNMPTVYFRTAIDSQEGIENANCNARLRLVPGSQHRDENSLIGELLRKEDTRDGVSVAADTERKQQPNALDMLRQHPRQVAVDLLPSKTLMWTTAALHSTEPQHGPGPRRVIEWRYAPAGRAPTLRDSRAAQLVFPEWQTWSLSRKRLWGLDQATRQEQPLSGPAPAHKIPVWPVCAAL